MRPGRVEAALLLLHPQALPPYRRTDEGPQCAEPLRIAGGCQACWRWRPRPLPMPISLEGPGHSRSEDAPAACPAVCLSPWHSSLGCSSLAAAMLRAPGGPRAPCQSGPSPKTQAGAGRARDRAHRPAVSQAWSLASQYQSQKCGDIFMRKTYFLGAPEEPRSPPLPR